MKIQINTRPYNTRRYSKPWIANVDFYKIDKGDFTFGSWIGDPGEEGLLVIEANERDIIATGQKDFRKPQNSAPTWYQVVDGELQILPNKVAAYTLSKELKNVQEN